MKTAIIYYSAHHGNTKKLLDAISKSGDITLFDITENKNINLEDFDTVGIASGIYFGKFHESINSFVQNSLPQNKNVFFIYTCGKDSQKYIFEIKKIALSKTANILGSYGCLGFDTFGPFKIIGGIAKGHPNSEEIKGAVNFFENLSKQKA